MMEVAEQLRRAVLVEDSDMMGPLELIRFIEANVDGPEQLHALAALSDAPVEGFQSKIKLPVQNELPAFSLGDGGVGSSLRGLDYGVPAPVPGQESPAPLSVGELLVGDPNAF